MLSIVIMVTTTASATVGLSWASSSQIKHQADMKQRARKELDKIKGSKQPDPVWYFPATHTVQLTSSIRPDADGRRGINFDSKQICVPKVDLE